MIKIIFVINILAFAVNSYGQTQSDYDSCAFRLDADFGVSTRNVWRGLDYGSSPSIWGDIFGSYKRFSLGVMGTNTLNGSKSQYGNWLEMYASYEYKNLTFIIDDYFFFNSKDSANNYFDYTPEKTQHLIEARFEYKNKVLEALVGYVVYSNDADNTNGVYLEATYKPNKKLSFTSGYLTNSQWLSFYNSGGLTTLGINCHSEIQFLKQKLPLKTSLIFNPNYKNASPLIGNNPAYFVISTDF